MSKPLNGRVALVTGGTHGIGLGIAAAYLQAGARVVVVGRDETRAERAVSSLAGLGEVTAVQGDVSATGEPGHIVNAAVKHFGSLDILVNVAGVFEASSFLETTEAQYDYQFDINVKGTYFCTQAAAEAMLAGGVGGKVINISSTAGSRGGPGVSVYCATKAAVDHLTRVLAAELAPLGINVNCIVPGNIDMPTNKLLSAPGAREATAAATPARRNGVPADVAAAAVYLASDAASFLHGASIAVDGGVLANG
jgi:NAD(P)-dependent dehydrogenase (short-subunit alcohol dehydrogenase family)